jgi:uncharacterized membrane protein YkvA (DUF1232 family)
VQLLLGIVAGLLLLWVLLLTALAVARPSDLGVKDALRLLPDVLRLIRALVGDPTLPRGVRVRLWLLLGYLVMPLDLVPDFVPVLGYADDAVVVVVALRSVVRRAGADALERHWTGTAEGLAVVRRLAGVA